jgi:uncharacterized phage-like protein YoqJ
MREAQEAGTNAGEDQGAALARGEIIAYSGHRPDKLGGWNPAHPVVGRVRFAIRESLIQLAPSMVIVGMALGVDQWAAQESATLGLPFTAALPCDDMDAAWPERSRAEFRALVRSAAVVHVVSPGPYKPWKMQRRNEWMVDNSRRLVAVHDGSSGGTFNCIRYAESVPRPIYRLRWRE